MANGHKFVNLHVAEHPLIQHKLTLMRDQSTTTQNFRQLLREIAMLLGYEITRDLALAPRQVTTPLAEHEGRMISGKKLAIVPILRAGLGMADGLLELVPNARVGHIGCYRDHETKRPVEYLVKLPDTTGRSFILVDPMLATGFSATHAVSVLKNAGVAGPRIQLMVLVAAPEGVAELHRAHPDVAIYAAALDQCLNENAYIVPGLGDAGDRLFGTA